MNMQASLFPTDNTDVQERINGLTYIPNFITPTEEATLLAAIDQQLWLTDLKRRVQHYGWKYDYTARRVDDSMRLGPLPDWLVEYCQGLYDKGHFSKLPDQVIINEYQPGQGIASHIDCAPCFEDTIASVSLGSPCVMGFTARIFCLCLIVCQFGKSTNFKVAMHNIFSIINGCVLTRKNTPCLV